MQENCIKYEYTLTAFVEKHGIKKSAELLNISYQAVHTMIGFKRAVFIKKSKGNWHYLEVKQWKRGKQKNKSKH